VFVDEDGNGSVDRRRYYLTLLSVDRRVGFVDVDADSGEADWYYYLTDPAGSVVAVTDADGTIVNRYDYDAFGNLIKDNSFENVPNRYQFHGRAYDEHRGDYHYRMRTYIPAHGRFTGPDMKIDPLDPNGACNYLFCRNNPLVYSDPWGLEEKDSSLIWLYIRSKSPPIPFTEKKIVELPFMWWQGAKAAVSGGKEFVSAGKTVSVQSYKFIEEGSLRYVPGTFWETLKSGEARDALTGATIAQHEALLEPFGLAMVHTEDFDPEHEEAFELGTAPGEFSATVQQTAAVGYGTSAALTRMPSLTGAGWLSRSRQASRLKKVSSKGKTRELLRKTERGRQELEARTTKVLLSPEPRFAIPRTLVGGSLNYTSSKYGDPGAPPPVPLPGALLFGSGLTVLDWMYFSTSLESRGTQ